MDKATVEEWNDWYRRILIKDLRCGVSEKTVNNVAKKMGIKFQGTCICMYALSRWNETPKKN